MKKNRFIAVAIFVTAFSLMLILVYFDLGSGEKIEIVEISTEESIEWNSAEPKQIALTEDIPIHTTAPIPTSEGTDNLESTYTAQETSVNTAMASITISANKMTRIYDIMPDVDEGTLKRNIGWLPGSALPGNEGLCILMGHRDTDFRILKDIEIGDRLYISTNGCKYTYRVLDIYIIERDNEMRFETKVSSTLVLVTCYPFRYSGHAPKKFVVYAESTID